MRVQIIHENQSCVCAIPSSCIRACSSILSVKTLDPGPKVLYIPYATELNKNNKITPIIKYGAGCKDEFSKLIIVFTNYYLACVIKDQVFILLFQGK